MKENQIVTTARQANKAKPLPDDRLKKDLSRREGQRAVPTVIRGGVRESLPQCHRSDL